ncbi:MAG: PA domain-containing protein [Xanthomonadales bacterium]|jgi:hypothetical protein|nr:PA domain-containing protein [Xanthomonadales bacterium]
MKSPLVLALATVALAVGSPAAAATIVINVADGAGEGFNDPNPPGDPSQRGNNPGTTLGELRLNLFETAANVWAGILDSEVTITVNARFDPLTCSASSGTLGFAGAAASSANVPNGLAGTRYPIALAESLAGANLNGSGAEINATFNSEPDTLSADCLGGGGYYYGLDGDAPAGQISLFSVVLHELGHGLGFASFAQENGQFSGGLPDIFSRQLRDLETGKNWADMSDAERAASSLNDPDLVWTGARVTTARGDFLDNAVEMVINSPPAIAGTFPVTLGQEPDIDLDSTGVTADVVDGDALGGCTFFANNAAVAGRIALFAEDGDCFSPFRGFFTETAGGVGAIISSDQPLGDASVSGQISNQDVTIPYVGTTQALGNDLRNNLPGANVTLRRSTTVFIGENAGRVRMYAPASFEAGSSVSHWSSAATPDLLMEPRLGNIGFDQVDLTVAAFQDMGWRTRSAGPPLIFKDAFEIP